MDTNTAILATMLIPSGALVTNLVFRDRANLRDGLTLAASVATFLVVLSILAGVGNATTQSFALFEVLPGLDLAFNVEPLGLLFAIVASGLWIVTHLYGVGYMRGNKEGHHARFFASFSLAIASTMGIAFAANMFTLFLFYELLTISTYPLVAHKGTPEAVRGARIYLAYTLGGGVLLLVGAIWLRTLAGPLDFVQGGILADIPGIEPDTLRWIFVLLIAGLGVKAALVPLHGWLPQAMVAPAPVSALLHAVAVVKAGAFGIVRVVYDVFGVEFTAELGLLPYLGAIAAFTIIYGSVKALSQDHLKKRLAYSTVSQVSYIALGAAILGPLATVGGVVHLVHQGVMKITLFFAAGNYAETLGIHRVSEMNGVGRRMPGTTLAFTIGALGMIGIPPVAGFISKWYLGLGAVEAGMAHWVLPVLVASSLLNAAYFLPILYRAWFRPAPQSWPDERPRTGRWEMPAALLWPPLITAGLAVAAGLFAAAAHSPLGWAELIASREYRG